MNTLLPKSAVVVRDGHAVTTSLIVAEIFEKQHKHVLDTIRNMGCPEEFNQPNFRPSFDESGGRKFGHENEFWRSNFTPRDYTDDRGKTWPMFEMTKDGFTLLVMGFTGEKAMQFKIAYIKRFNEMEAALLHPQALPEPRPTETIDAVELQNLRLKLELAEMRLEKATSDLQPKRTVFTDAERQTIRSLKAQGLTSAEIGKRINRNKHSVANFIYRERKRAV